MFLIRDSLKMAYRTLISHFFVKKWIDTEVLFNFFFTSKVKLVLIRP